MKRHIFSLAVLACSMSIFAKLPYQNPKGSPHTADYLSPHQSRLSRIPWGIALAS